jgi:RNA polymerase sigma factor (sigma-70 family)
MGKPPFERVVTVHGAVVLRVCRAVLGVHDAEDAWSETFLSALKAYPDLPEDANLQAWLVTIAHRKAIDVLRTRQRQALPLAELPHRESPFGNPGNGHPEVLDAVGQLPPKQRQAVAYHYLAGLPYKDISVLLGVSPEAARRAGADGVKALRAALGPTTRLA